MKTLLLAAALVALLAGSAAAQFVPMQMPTTQICTTFCSGSGNSRTCTTICN